MPKLKITDTWKPEETFSFEKDGKTITLQTHVLTLEDGRKLSVSKKPEFQGFEAGKEYDFEIGEKSTSGKTFKAKHVTVQPVKCPSCNHEFVPTFGQPASKPAPTNEPSKEDYDEIPF